MIAGTAWVVLALEWQQPNWVVFGFVGIGALFALSVMYELGCLVVVVAVFGGIWIATNALFPDFKLSLPLQVGLVAAFAYYAWYTGSKAQEMARQCDRSINGIRQAIVELADSMDAKAEFSRDDMRDLSLRVKRLERLAEDPFAEFGDSTAP
ncbi:hypothetical protein ACW5EG_02100 [Luteimonas sp. A611]